MFFVVGFTTLGVSNSTRSCARPTKGFDKCYRATYLITAMYTWSYTGRWLSLCAVGVLCGGCRLEIPEGPEMEGVAAKYEDPQGVLVEEDLVDIAVSAEESIRSIDRLSDYAFVLETLQGVGDAVAKIAFESDVGLNVRAVSDVRRTCPGHGETERDDPKNGSLEFRLTVRDTALQDTVWGSFDACRFVRLGKRIEYTGSVEIFLGSAVPLKDFRFDRVLFRFVGTALLDGREYELNWDFRASRDGIVEVGIPAQDGDVVFRFDTANLSQAAVRTRNGSFCCYFEQRACYVLSGNECGQVSAGDQRLQW